MNGDTWVLGRFYSDTEKRSAVELQRHISSLIRLTYRKEFAALSPYHYTDDAGWGCMLRSAQSMMAQTLLRHYLGDDWRLSDDLDARRSNAAYVEILRWFADIPGLPHVYSIHNMVQCGMRYDKLPGEWVGPSTAAFVLRDITKLHHRKHNGELEVYVTNGDTIYISEVNKLCTSSKPEETDPSRIRAAAVESVNLLRSSMQSAVRQSELTSSRPTTFFDPLHHMPPDMNADTLWSCSLLVIIPMKLGVYNVSEAYQEEVKRVLRHKQCVGILGGRPNHAIYFMGYSSSRGNKDQLLGLDPHTVFSTTHYLTDPFPSPELLAQVHPSILTKYFSETAAPDGQTANVSATVTAFESLSVPPAKLPIDQLDPSIGIGFYFRTKREFEEFCNEKSKKSMSRSGNHAQKPKGGLDSLFSGGRRPSHQTEDQDSVSLLYNIEYAPPSYDFSLHDQDEDEDGDSFLGSSSKAASAGSTAAAGKSAISKDEDKDQEYVFI